MVGRIANRIIFFFDVLLQILEVKIRTAKKFPLNPITQKSGIGKQKNKTFTLSQYDIRVMHTTFATLNFTIYKLYNICSGLSGSLVVKAAYCAPLCFIYVCVLESRHRLSPGSLVSFHFISLLYVYHIVPLSLCGL